MSFNYQDVEAEAYKKMAERPEGKNYVWVTPNKLPNNFPLKDRGPQACCLPFGYKKVAEEIKNFKVYEDDVWIVTFPRSGTTWCQEMIYLLRSGLDYEKALNTPLTRRSPFLELDILRDMPGEELMIEKFNKSPRPRLMKSHLPIQLLPDEIWTVKPKMIYLFRNAKDVAVSYFHQYQTWDNYLGGMKEYIDCFVEDLLLWSPFHAHISSFLELSEISENVHLVKYEDMKKDLRQEILRMAKFLEVEILEDDVLKLIDHLSFDSMKKNSAVNNEREAKEALASTNRSNENDPNLHFIRKGEVGGWKNELTAEMTQKIDEWSNQKVENDKYLQKYFM